MKETLAVLCCTNYQRERESETENRQSLKRTVGQKDRQTDKQTYQSIHPTIHIHRTIIYRTDCYINISFHLYRVCVVCGHKQKNPFGLRLIVYAHPHPPSSTHA